jgi:ParB-like chromosome segregation protein Spo0J
VKTVTVPIEQIVEDFNVYPRTMVSGPHTATIRDAMQAGEKMPPVILDKKSMRIVDGFHRYRAHKQLKHEKVECELRPYKTEADLFADAVRLNATHGRPLVPFERKRAVEMLRRYNVDDARIVQIIKAPIERVIEITSRFATTEAGEERALKAPHERMLAGGHVTAAQETADGKRDGMNPTYHARQLVIAIKSGLYQNTPGFHAAMDELCALWEAVPKDKKKAG